MSALVRVDDPQETVEIRSMEKSLDGLVHFDILTPSFLGGQRLRHGDFRRLYKDPTAVRPLTRPHSRSSAGEWRQWALHLEQRISEFENVR